MHKPELPILQNDEVRARTSHATLRVLENRAHLPWRATRFLSPELFATLQQLVDAILPQEKVGTSVEVAETIDWRLQNGMHAGWRYASLPPDGEAYRQGLAAFNAMLEQTSRKDFAATAASEREDYLRSVANGDVDGPAQFPLSLWLQLVRTDVVRIWISHPDAMQAMHFYGFADGATGNEGWVSIGPNTATPFEYVSTASGGKANDTGEAAR